MPFAECNTRQSLCRVFFGFAVWPGHTAKLPIPVVEGEVERRGEAPWATTRPSRLRRRRVRSRGLTSLSQLARLTVALPLVASTPPSRLAVAAYQLTASGRQQIQRPRRAPQPPAVVARRRRAGQQPAPRRPPPLPQPAAAGTPPPPAGPAWLLQCFLLWEFGHSLIW